MKGYHANIEEQTLNNTDFRRVIYTGAYSQLVLMSLKPNESIGMEVHGNDQFFRFETGSGLVVVDGTEYKVADGDCVVVPAGAKHNVTNTSTVDELKLYTLYSPPHHADKTIHATKAQADASKEVFDGNPTE